MQRQILRDWAELAVRSPLWTEPDPDESGVERRFAAIAGFGDRVLRVAVREFDTEILVLTAVFDRRATRQMRRGLRP